MSARTGLYWALRRELWENRSLYYGPIFIAVLALAGAFINAGAFAEKIRALPALEAAKQVKIAVVPYSLAAAVILFTGWVVAAFYCLESLYGERRDRSILFWKSMPVSDLTTVASKAAVALVVAPVIACAVALATQSIVLLAHTAVLLAKGVDPGTLWARMPFVQMPLGMVYGMVVHSLWFAPVFAYLMLVSAWARRAPFVWAFLPFFAAYALETIAFGTQHVAKFLQFRFTGGMAYAFKPGALKGPITELAQLDPGRFLATPSVWIGLAFAAAFLAAAVRLRRYREPI